MLHKKSILALALIAAPLFAQAAITQGQLTFTWQATVPPEDLASTAWKFTDATGADYVPTPVALRAIVDPDDKSLNLVTQAPANFEIRSNSSSNLTSVAAYLAGNPTTAGFTQPLSLKTELAAPQDNEVIVVLNDKALKVGSSNQVTIESSISNTSTSMSLGLYAKVKEGNYTPGGSVSFTTPVVFSVNIADVGGASA